MSDQADKLLSEAMKLTAQERARVASELIASVDGEPDVDAEAAWGEEIDRRVQQVKAEGTRGDDWKAVHDRIAARIQAK